MSLLETILSSMITDDSVASLAKKTGASSDKMSGVVSAALPFLMQAMTSNASSSDGAASLLGALAQHTDTSSIAQQIAEADADDGSAIIGHILGGNTENVVSQISEQTDMAPDEISSVLNNIAPAVLSSVSAANTAQVQQSQQSSGGLGLGGLLGGLFGASQGSSLLGSLFSGNDPQENASVDGSDLLNLLMKAAK